MKKTFRNPELEVIELNSDIVTASCPNDTGFGCFVDNKNDCPNDTGFGGF